MEKIIEKHFQRHRKGIWEYFWLMFSDSKFKMGQNFSKNTLSRLFAWDHSCRSLYKRFFSERLLESYYISLVENTKLQKLVNICYRVQGILTTMLVYAQDIFKKTFPPGLSLPGMAYVYEPVVIFPYGGKPRLVGSTGIKFQEKRRIFLNLGFDFLL